MVRSATKIWQGNRKSDCSAGAWYWAVSIVQTVSIPRLVRKKVGIITLRTVRSSSPPALKNSTGTVFPNRNGDPPAPERRDSQPRMLRRRKVLPALAQFRRKLQRSQRMTAILGISAFYHDSAAALVVDGDVVGAAQEERFTRKKHDPGFPFEAIAYCLQEGSLEPDQLDYIAFYDKPLTKFERLLETYLAYAPRGLRSFSLAMPLWLKDKLHLRSKIRKGLSRPTKAPLVFLDHHESHAASAFLPSPFEKAAILTLDGVGEWSTTTYGIGEGNKVRLTHHLQFPHSLGLLYSAFTYYCGFKVNSGEYKLMGLAPYGRPLYQDTIYKHLIDLKADGSFWLNMKYFNYYQGLTMTNRRFHALFGGPPRRPESDLQQRHMDLAASIQAVTEEIMLRMGCDLHKRTGMRHLVLAGGVALNCVANGRLLREGPYEDVWIQPAAGDAGGA